MAGEQVVGPDAGFADVPEVPLVLARPRGGRPRGRPGRAHARGDQLDVERWTSPEGVVEPDEANRRLYDDGFTEGPALSSILSPAARREALADAAAGTHDVVVVGGGVTGAGVALDAAARGLSVVLLEAGDIAVGTSSRSGKTMHGGLRYLEQLNFSLVFGALREHDVRVEVASQAG